MFQFMSPTLPANSSKFSLPVSEIERFRARHRRLCRGQQQTATSSRIEALDVDEGRTRKISAKWSQKQQQTQLNQFEDGYWPKSAGTEMHLGFNAFDFSASPEAFYDDAEESVEVKSHVIDTNQQDDEEQPEPSVEAEPASVDENELQERKQHMAHVAKQVTAMGFNSASLWERKFPGLRQPGGPIRQMPTLNQNSMWGAPVHFATYEDQRRALYYRPQYYA